MNTRTVTRSIFTSPAHAAIEPLESRIAPAITLLGVPNWFNEGPGPTTGGQVEGMGDNQVVGAIEKIAAHPTDANIVYVATVNGGIWKTGNATAANPSWTPLTETLPALGFASIAFDPTDASGNTLWAGYGRLSSGGGDGGPLLGIIKTTNGGTTWTDVGGSIADGQTFRSLIPTGVNDGGSGQQIVMAASISSATGLLRSTDNGATFTDISDGTAGHLPDAAVSHLVGDPGSSTRFYAAVPGSGIYISTDTGATWTQVNTGLGGVVASSRIELSVSGAAGNPVFAGVISGGTLSGMFRSANQGGNWTQMDTPQTNENGTSVGLNPEPEEEAGGQAGTHFSILADRTNGNIVFVGGDRQPSQFDGAGKENGVFPNSVGASAYSGRLFRGDASLAAGTQFAPVTNNGAGGTSPHADSRDMVFDANGNILESDDGGIYRLSNPNAAGRTWSEVIGNLRNTEFYSTAYDPVNELIIGGAQDTGVHEQPAGGGTTWSQVTQGDGNITAISVTPDGVNPVAHRYSMSNNFGSFTLRNDPLIGATTSSSPALTGLNATDSGFTGFSLFPFVTNAVSTVAASGRLLIGGNGLYESTDFGSTVTDITIAGQNNYQSLAYGGRSGGVDNPDVAYVGVGNEIYLRTAAAGAFTLLTAFPGSTAADIVLNANDWRDAFVLDGNQVFRTIDAGTTWADITGDLGTLSTDLRTIEFYDGAGTPALVVGGFGGVFRLTLDGTPAVASDWSEYGMVLPNVIVKEVSFDAGDDILVAGTWGRGAWSVSSVSASINVAGILEINGDTDFAGQDDTIRLVLNQANPNLIEVFLNNNTSTPNLIVERSQIERININGLGGNDTVIIDSSNGLVDVQDGIHYDGGSGHDAMRLEQPGNATPQTSDVYSVGPAIGGGSSVITGPSGEQNVQFENLEPVLDLVPAASQIVNATPENNAIDYAAGAVPANGRITIDSYESFEFSNKVALTINGLAGSDEISLNNPTTPTGLTNITVDGGNPAASDTLIYTGRTGLSDNIRLAPTGAGAGTVTNTGVPSTAFAGIEHLDFVLQFGNDNFTVDGTAGNDDYRVFSGSNPGQVHIEGTMNRNLSAFALPDIDVTGNSSTVVGNYNFNGAGGTDLFTLTGTVSDDEFILIRAGATDASASHSVNGTAANLFGMSNLSELTVDGLDGDDDFTVPGNFPFTLNLSGGDPSGSDVLDFNGTGAAVTANLTAGTIQETGFSVVTLSGVEVANIDGGAADLTLLGAAGGDVLTLTPNATDYDLRDETPGLTLTSTNTALLDLNLGGGTDWLTLFGTAIADSFGFTGTSATSGVLLLNVLPQITYSNTERAVLDGLDGDDLFLLGSALGRIGVVGGDGSDTVDFSVSPSSVHFDLDAVGIAQFVNLTGEIVTLLERMENFVGTAFNDILNVDAATFPRTVNGGPHLLPLPPGDKLILDGQGELVTVVKSDFNTGVIHTKGHEDVVFDEFETIKIINSSGGIFDSKSFSAGIVYDLTQEVPAPGKPIPGKAPTGVATGDLNGDGFADIVTANNRSGNMSVLINKGDGTFNPPVNIKTGANPQDIALGDFDGDTDLDVVITNSGASNVAVLLGNGAGGFGAPTLIKTKPKPGAIALGDLNGDLVNDLVVTHVGRNTISVLIGNGAGGFGAPVETKTGGTGPLDVVIADFDLDTDNDVAIVNTSSRTISLLTGNGAGGFAGAPEIFKVGVKPTGLAVTDVNIDGSPDLVVSHYVSRFVGVLLGNGAVAGPQFKLMNRANFPGTHGPNAVAVADFNGDGFIDLGFANGLGGKFTAILGNGLGDFSSPYEFDMGDTSARKVSALSIVDVNNDGGLDIVTANTGTSDISVLLRNLV